MAKRAQSTMALENTHEEANPEVLPTRKNQPNALSGTLFAIFHPESSVVLSSKSFLKSL